MAEREGAAVVRLGDLASARQEFGEGRAQALRLFGALSRDLAATDPVGYAACCDALAAYDLRPDPARITAPTLVVGGSLDLATPLDHARELADGIADATLEACDIGHIAVEQPEAVGGALKRPSPRPERATVLNICNSLNSPHRKAANRTFGSAVIIRSRYRYLPNYCRDRLNECFPELDRRAASTALTSPVSLQRHARRRRAEDDGWATEIPHGRCHGRCGHASTECGRAGIRSGRSRSWVGVREHEDSATKFVDPLPIPRTAISDPSVYPGADYYEITMRPGTWHFHRDLGPAKVWGYWAANPHDPRKPIGMGYLGPTLDVTRDHPTVVKYRNHLPTTHLFQFVINKIRNGDPQLTPTPPPPYKPVQPFPANVNVWNVVHQHGGFTAPQSDGMPLQSFSPDGIHAESYSSLDPSRVEPNEQICAYTNHDRSCMLWYHDHGMGMTSVNVYAGLAGLYRVGDPADDRLGLPRGEFEVPLILQDRTFHPDGSLAYTMTLQQGEDTPVVNGKAYPFLEVERRRYRLRVLNASNERFWRLRFDVPEKVMPQPVLPFWLIGTDGGLRTPLQMLNFLISPAERYDLIVDFSKVPMGTKVTLTNYNAPVHFPGGDGPEISEVMEFHVTKRPSGGGDRTTPPMKLELPKVEPIKVTASTSTNSSAP